MTSANSDMTIRDIRVTMLRLPWTDDPWLRGHALGATRDILICEVETSGGITGMGYLFVFRPGMASIAACLDECIIPRVKGKDATAIEAIWRDLWTATMTYGRGGIAAMAMSAIDIALWDAVGKRAGLPLHRLWGHYRSQIPIYGSGCFRGAGGDGMIEKALHFVKQGYTAIKMQVAHVHTLAQDLDNVRRMREALGPDIDIMIDVNMGWSADVAIEMGRKFEQYDIYWLEEPVPADDFAGYQRIAAALDIALWDAVGRRAGLPLHKLWGHNRSKIPIYGSGCFRGAGGDGMIEKALTYVSQGYKAIKMQVAHIRTPAEDLENVRRIDRKSVV